jgi:glycosyltransferase involved in cell wall biosynthesis
MDLIPSPGEGVPVPKLTVAMPVFNGGRYLRLAVASIICQTFQDWELLIIDDGSTDPAIPGLSDIVDSRVRIVRDDRNLGLAVRLNEAIGLARGEYFARMDHDDVSYPERFARQLALLEAEPKLDLVAVRALKIANNNDVLGRLPGPLTHSDICARPWLGFHFPHPTWMGRTAWFHANRYATPGPFCCEDQELLLRSHAGSRFATIDQVLFAYRMRDRINWKKQLKTRWTLVALQMRYFSRAGQWGYACLSLLAFIGRIGSDGSALLRQVCSGKFFQQERVQQSDTIQWKRVMNYVVEKD